MIRHIVMIKLNNSADKQNITDRLKSMLEQLELTVESLNKIEVGINISTKQTAYDVVLTADFDDEVGLDEYRVHPQHIKVLGFLKIVMEKATVVDYII